MRSQSWEWKSCLWCVKATRTDSGLCDQDISKQEDWERILKGSKAKGLDESLPTWLGGRGIFCLWTRGPVGDNETWNMGSRGASCVQLVTRSQKWKEGDSLASGIVVRGLKITSGQIVSFSWLCLEYWSRFLSHKYWLSDSSLVALNKNILLFLLLRYCYFFVNHTTSLEKDTSCKLITQK